MREELRVRGVVDEPDTFTHRRAKIDGVPLSGGGHGNDAVAPFDAALQSKDAGLVQQSFRLIEEQTAEIVDGNDVRFLKEQRNAVKRDVRNVRPDPPDQLRKVEVIPPGGIAHGIFVHVEIGGKAGEIILVVRVGDEFVLMLWPGEHQGLPQIADISADTEVPDAADVDGDFHIKLKPLPGMGDASATFWRFQA